MSQPEIDSASKTKPKTRVTFSFVVSFVKTGIRRRVYELISGRGAVHCLRWEDKVTVDAESGRGVK